MTITLLTDGAAARDEVAMRPGPAPSVIIRRVAGDPAEAKTGVLDLRDPEQALGCCEPGAVIAHLAAVPRALRDNSPAVDPTDGAGLIDFAARGTYNLFSAARARHAERVILVSTLALFDGYAPNLIVSEWWKPRPAPTAEHLAIAAAEEVAYQFCLEGGICGVCLRTESGHAELDLIARAAEVELGAPGYRWRVFHVSTSPRFASVAAGGALGWWGSDE